MRYDERSMFDEHSLPCLLAPTSRTAKSGRYPARQPICSIQVMASSAAAHQKGSPRSAKLDHDVCWRHNTRRRMPALVGCGYEHTSPFGFAHSKGSPPASFLDAV